MKADEVRKMGDDQLAMTLKDTEKHLFQLRFQSATDRLETPSEISKARKDIARIKTEQHVRVLKVQAAQSFDVLKAELAAAELGEAGGKPIMGVRKPTRLVHRLTKLVAAKGK